MSASARESEGTTAAGISQSLVIRAARADEARLLASLVGELLVELGGVPVDDTELERAAVEVLANPDHGAVLLALSGEQVVGLLAVSWVMAVHAGRYALIQDLWVDPRWRSRAVGRALVADLCTRARDRGARRVEVGLPSERFPMLGATEAFYLRNGFTPLGPRMRRLLA